MKANPSMSILSKELAKHKREYLIFTHNPQGKLLRVSIPTSTSTVSHAIDIATAQFNRVHSLQLPEDGRKYKLYAANFNGTRVKQYPSLDQQQELILINLGQFYLKKRAQPRKAKELKESRISLGFQLEKKRPERRIGKEFGCVCFGL